MSNEKALSHARYIARLIAGMALDFSLEGYSESDARTVSTLRIAQELLTKVDGVEPLTIDEDGDGQVFLNSRNALSYVEFQEIKAAWATLRKHGVTIDIVDRRAAVKGGAA